MIRPLILSKSLSYHIETTFRLCIACCLMVCVQVEDQIQLMQSSWLELLILTLIQYASRASEFLPVLVRTLLCSIVELLLLLLLLLPILFRLLICISFSSAPPNTRAVNIYRKHTCASTSTVQCSTARELSHEKSF